MNNHTLTVRSLRRRAGFSLIEMLVVIGILGVLAAVTLSQFSGATESAKAAQCMSNMRNLAVAAGNYAMANEWGNYPHADSYTYAKLRGRELGREMAKGWVSRDKSGMNGGWSKNGKVGGSVPFNTQDDILRAWAITNGTLWQYVGNSYEVYTCPVHVKACQKKNGKHPAWSFVMNQEFGYASSGETDNWVGKNMSSLPGPERWLLFAELQAMDVKNTGKRGERVAQDLRAMVDVGGTEADGVLQWDREFIGFNHKSKSGYMGHVAFADGHVQKVMCPQQGSLKELTEWMCKGYELSFDGKQYRRTDK